ncbi:hypothetical protein [Daejeonella lutea]|uniref:Uncharacterized protein n=1 Tax=Daejeonella lutea TaxID=572036 RepID=A0A1T5B6H8_9SPHI|nr:hypothetical protein [Daejeonella lutea]SKB42836.1 hypothetical protein SAMN05661099_1354 [Daejeonella lutea]
MARFKNNLLMKGTSGQLNQQMVLKTYGNKTFLSKLPDMSKVEFNENQKAEQGLFSDAITYARSIINDPKRKAEFKATLEPGRRVYNAAISAYLKEHKSKKD